jgi:hypothetical protein
VTFRTKGRPGAIKLAKLVSNGCLEHANAIKGDKPDPLQEPCMSDDRDRPVPPTRRRIGERTDRMETPIAHRLALGLGRIGEPLA